MTQPDTGIAYNHTGTKNQDHPVRDFLWGAVPAAVAAIAVLWQLLQPYVHDTAHQILLFGLAVFCGNISLAVWLWCTVWLVSHQFTERNRRADERSQRLQQEMYVMSDQISERLDKLCRSVEGLHRHLAQTDQQLESNGEEISHVRKLILNSAEPIEQNQRLGPRSLN